MPAGLPPTHRGSGEELVLESQGKIGLSLTSRRFFDTVLFLTLIEFFFARSRSGSFLLLLLLRFRI